MDGLDPLEGSSPESALHEVIQQVFVGILILICLAILPYLNPPIMTADDKTNPGTLIVEARWDDDLNADVDLWVQALSEQPVGYSNKGGQLFNLLRDDLGLDGDFSQLNYEVSYSRGMPAGSYTVNLHLYRNKAKVYPIPVSVVVSLKHRPDESSREILKKRMLLRFEGGEATAFRFDLDDHAQIVPGSVQDL